MSQLKHYIEGKLIVFSVDLAHKYKHLHTLTSCSLRNNIYKELLTLLDAIHLHIRQPAFHQASTEGICVGQRTENTNFWVS